MTSLVVVGSEGKAAEAYLGKLIEAEQWELVFLISESPLDIQAKHIQISEDSLLSEITETIRSSIDGKIPDTEVALNMVAGPGKIHMATLAALLKCGLGIRLVAMTPEGMKEL